uniref:Uncharacterized protein n=1 Tax=Anopheles maculatus TaxID=74869 RepID=A0A182SGU6_9DIPT
SQRQKLQKFIISDIQPASFRTPFSTTAKAQPLPDYDSYLYHEAIPSSVRSRNQHTFLKAIATTLSATQSSTFATTTPEAPIVRTYTARPTPVAPSRPEPFGSDKSIRLTHSSQDWEERRPLSTFSFGSSAPKVDTRPEQKFSSNRFYNLTLSSGFVGLPGTASSAGNRGRIEIPRNQEPLPSYTTFTLSDAVTSSSRGVSTTVSEVLPETTTPFTTFTMPATTTTTTTTLSPISMATSSGLTTTARPRYSKVQDENVALYKSQDVQTTTPTAAINRLAARPSVVPTAASDWIPLIEQKILSSPKTNTLHEQEDRDRDADDPLLQTRVQANTEDAFAAVTTASTPPTRFPPRTTLAPFGTLEGRKSVEKVQSLPPRNLVSKETPSKTIDPVTNAPTRLVVSPYKSLEVQRQTTSSDKPFASTSRVISNLYRTTTPEIPAVGGPTVKSYFQLTAVPKLAAILRETTTPSTTTVRLTTTTTSTTVAPSSTTTVTSTSEQPATTTTTRSTSAPTSTTLPTTTFSSSSEEVITTSSTLPRSTEVYRGRYRPVFSFVRSSESYDEATTPRYRYLRNRGRGSPRRSYTRLRPTAQSYTLASSTVDDTLSVQKSSSPSSTLVPTGDYSRTADSTVLSIASEYDDRVVSSSSASAAYLNRIPTTDRTKYQSTDRDISKTAHVKSRYEQFEFNRTEKEDRLRQPVSTTGQSNRVVQITDKPVYYTRFHSTSTEESSFAVANSSRQPESTTKKFRATVEMPEMNIPTEKELLSYHQDSGNTSEDEDRDDDDDEDDIEDDDLEPVDEDLADYSYLETSSVPSTTTTTSSTTPPTTTTTTTTTSTTTTTTTSAPPSTTSTTTLRSTFKPMARASKRYTTPHYAAIPAVTTERSFYSAVPSRFYPSTTQGLNLTAGAAHPEPYSELPYHSAHSTSSPLSSSSSSASSSPAYPSSTDAVSLRINDGISKSNVSSGSSSSFSQSSTTSPSIPTTLNTTTTITTTTTTIRPPTTYSVNKLPPRASRVNNAIKTTIAAAQLPRRYSKPSAAGKSIQCTENSLSAKCNEIPSSH